MIMQFSAPLIVNSHEDGEFSHPHFVPPIQMTPSRPRLSNDADFEADFESAFLRSRVDSDPSQFASRSGFEVFDKSDDHRRSNFERQKNGRQFGH